MCLTYTESSSAQIFEGASIHANTCIYFNNLVKWCEEYFNVPVIYEITVLLLRTFRFPEIRTCEETDKLRPVINLVSQCFVKDIYLVHP